jgi:hypothetical protein
MQTTAATADETRAGIVAPAGAPSLPPRISWGAVFAGAVVAITVGVMLNVLGLAVGATTIDPAVPGDTPSASTLGTTSGIWLVVANLIGLGIGGWAAARLSGTTDGTDGMLHGLSVWAIGFLLSAVLLGNIVSGTVGTVFQGASSIIGGTMQGAGQAAGQAAQSVAPQLAQALNPEQMIERLQQGLQTGGDPAQMTEDQRRAEIARILGDRLREGGFSGNQRDRLTQLVAAESNLSPQEADARIEQLETRAREMATEAATQARVAAENAADAAAMAAYLIFGLMLLGAAAAVIGARIGTRRALRVHGYG